MEQHYSYSIEPLVLEPTQNTPSVNFNPENGLLIIQGVSMPENVITFYTPLIEWLKEYFKTTKSSTELHLKLDYFNTATSKILLEFFNLFEAQHLEHQAQCAVAWHFDEEDLDMREAGEDYKYLLTIPFVLLPYPHTEP